MPECQLCGETEEELTRCKKCKSMFCEYCGSQEEKTCIDCLDSEEEDYEDDDIDYIEEPVPEIKVKETLPRTQHLKYLRWNR